MWGPSSRNACVCTQRSFPSADTFHMLPLAGVALTAGRTLLTKIGLNAGTLSKAGAWLTGKALPFLKNMLWGSNLAKASTVVSGGLMMLPAGAKTAAQSSGAAAQLARYNPS